VQRDGLPFFCIIKNLPWLTIALFQGIIQLEKELAFLGSMCAAALMKKDLALPIGTESCG